MEFKYENGCFSAVEKGNTILSYRQGDPVLTVGTGSNSYEMKRGSFRIREKKGSHKELTLIGAEKLGDDKAKLILSEGVVSLTVSRKTNHNLRISVHFEGLEGYNRMYVRLPAKEDEHIYGCGEQFVKFDLRGQKVRVWVAEHINFKCVARKLAFRAVRIYDRSLPQRFSAYETYYAQPTFLSSRKYYFHSDTTARCEFDFRAEKFHLLKIDQVADFTIGIGDSFADVLEDLTDLNGRQPELPDWVYDGEILGIQGGTEIMLNKVKNTLEHGFAVNGVWIQDWQGRRITAAGKQLFWNWQWDEELYPDLPGAIRDLGEQGIRVLGYCNPFLAVEKPLYKEASAKGYCVKNKAGEDYYVTITTFPAAMVDLTNPEARTWIKGIIRRNMIDFGLSGWMADFGEYLPTDAVLYSGEDAELVHNTWPARWAELNREVLEESGKVGEIMFFTRAGYTSTARYSTMMWNGDNHVDFSPDYGMPSVIPAMLSLTCSGFGLSHSDIGGYTSFSILKRSEELYMRWVDMNTFSPVLRGHEGLNPDHNAQFDASEEVLVHSGRMSTIHAALKPYLKAMDKINSERGTGVVRPIFFEYDEPEAYSEAYEYMLGSDLLVAPVIRAGASAREVYLPQDAWIHLPSGREYTGGRYKVEAPIGQPPVFARKDSEWSDLFKGLFN